MKDFVLVVEDSTLQAKMISDLLTEHGIGSEVAVSGAIAIEKASTGKFNLILMDMVLPDTSGLSLITQLKEREETSKLPIIMLSGVTDKDNVVSALTKGVNDYITKPYHPQELIVRINLQLTLLHNLQELKANHTAKSKIFSVLAHDIKSPFNTLLGFTDIISDAGLSPDKMRQYAKTINQSAKNIYTVLDNVLIWTGMQSGALKPAMVSIPLALLAEELMQLYQPIVREKKQSLTFDFPQADQVKADRNMIGSVLRNLIINAIKFTHEGGSIKVAAVVSPSGTTITVSDTGMGINKEDKAKLFGFDNNRRIGTNGEKGTGLGLPLCKEFMEAMGGNISVESAPDKGSVFKIWLPA